MRARWLAVGAFAVGGCHIPLPAPDPAAGPAESCRASPEPARGLARFGFRAADLTPVGSVESPPDALTRAADCLGRGDRPAAAAHLAAHVRQHPDQLMFRAQLAELLFALDRPAAARAEFERFVADAQATGGTPAKHLTHCHTRLMEIGQKADDRFAERFHRGVGLLLVAAGLGADDGAEEVVCQAVKALAEAKELRPADPRVHLYLADAYDLAGNRRAAAVARGVARDRAGPGLLTPTEAARLNLR